MAYGGDEEMGGPLDKGPQALDELGRKLKSEHEGLSWGYSFLEASEVGDDDSLQLKLASLSGEERRAFIKAVDQQGRSALLISVKRGNAAAKCVEMLLDAQANPNDGDFSGVTALHYAAASGSSEILGLLLGARADPERRDDLGAQPLAWARGKAVTQLLLVARADPHAKDNGGRTALMAASSIGEDASVEVLAAVPGTDLEAQDSRGVTALGAAEAAGSMETVAILERLGAQPQGAGSGVKMLREGVEALHEAARRCDASACMALLAASGDKASELDVNAELCGETALLLAAAAGPRGGRTVEVLLQARADPSRADTYMRETPLVRSVVAHGGCEVLWMLLEAKADPSAVDLSGRTPVDVAEAWGRKEEVEILRAAADGTLGLGDLD
mmetsp:Transcript_21363/g.63708  ORF Transcript_21363/g.63708 Transcript_21363/m.63708 type:complete len:388 (-) Transcript_21363:92-1255(-)